MNENEVVFHYYALVKEKQEAACQDRSLSWAAQGIFHCMAKLHTGIKFPINFFLRVSASSEETVKMIMAELIEKGYVTDESTVVDISGFGENLEK